MAKKEQKEMSFLDHVEVLRWHLVRSSIAVLLLSIIAFIMKGFIFNTKTNAEWRMQFLWPIKMPFLIIDLDEDYSYTVIGVPNRKYVWIMSRESSMNSDIFETIINKLKKVGYDTTQIKTIKQEW